MNILIYTIAFGAWVTAPAQAKDDRDFNQKWTFLDWYSYEYERGPYQFDPALWGLFMRNEVARGYTTFQGANISEPYGTENSKSVDWTVSVNLATNISLDYSSDKEAYNASSFVSGGVLSMAPSNDLWDQSDDQTLYADPSWKICLYYPNPSEVWTADAEQKTLHKEENCRALFSKKCVGEIKDRISELLADDDEKYVGGCKPFFPEDLPDVCLDDGDFRVPPTFNNTAFQMGDRAIKGDKGVPILSPWDLSSASKTLNKDPPDDLDQLPKGKLEPSYANGSALFQWASTMGDPGNMTSLDQIGYITPLFIAFAPNITYMKNDTKKTPTIGRIGVDFVCAQADKTTGDYLKEVPEAPESGAARVGVGLWTIGAAAAVMLL